MLTAIRQRVDREDDGFTLIELMVVVLIIAILLAIAIPTFLGARNTANARGAQENLRNALTAEQTQWTNTQAFSSDATVMGGLEPGLSWSTAAAVSSVNNQVAVFVTSGATTPDVVVLQAQGKDGKCWYIEQSDMSSLSFTGYGVSSGTCAAPTVPADASIVAPSAGSASQSTIATGGGLPTFYTNF